jgi:hypothetical protein
MHSHKQVGEQPLKMLIAAANQDVFALWQATDRRLRKCAYG